MKQNVTLLFALILFGIKDLIAQSPILIKDIQLGSNNSIESITTSTTNPAFLIGFGKGIIFPANDGINGRELWISDGTLTGTKLLKDINPGSGSSFPTNLVFYNNEVYFVAYTVNNGKELWKTDGTESGTTLVSDIYPGINSSSLAGFAAINGKLYIGAYDGKSNVLCVIDSTANMNKILLPAATNSPKNFIEFNSNVYFQDGWSFWHTDGTSTGTYKILNKSYIGELTNAGNYIIFSGGVGGTEIWKSDGTATGTILIKDSLENARFFVNFKNQIIFDSGERLWKTDGTKQGTYQFSDVQITQYGRSLKDMVEWNGKLIFSAQPEPIFPGNFELYSYDGSNVNLVKDIYPQTGEGSFPEFFINTSKYVVFTANNFEYGNEIWKTDGTEIGTKLLADVNPGYKDSDPELYTYVEGNLYFTATTAASGREIYKLDINTGLTNLIFTTDIAKIYPNPVSNLLYIDLYNENQDIKINIRNAIGDLIYQQNGVIPINMNHLPHGMYIIEILNNNKIQTQKIIH